MQLYEGIIKSWKADKGFGFIQPHEGGKDIFIHIRDLKHSNYQPKQGDDICYKVVADKDGKLRAYDAFIKGQETSQLYRKKTFKKNRTLKEKKRPEYPLGMTATSVIAITPFVFSAILIKERLNFLPFFAYLILSLLTFIVYAFDKTKAHKNERRIPEQILHFLEFLGGWPGALITQRVIRHKNKKKSFQAIFWVIVIIHITVWINILFFGSIGIGPIFYVHL
jgi:uncharacterized membrane protein YsdA (DUF1294 family)/cold shock CspA family protein